MHEFTSRYRNLLHGQRAARNSGRPRLTLGRTLRGVAVVVVCLAGLGGLASASTLALGRVGTIPSAETSTLATGEQLASIELAQAFTTALNAHDVDALVELFTEADSGPTVTADRYAWQKFEISLWAQQQVRMNIRIEAYDYRLTEQSVTWDADVYRADWAALGVKVLPVTNTIWAHDGKVADFTSKPRNPHDAEQLGFLWHPGATPERPAR